MLIRTDNITQIAEEHSSTQSAFFLVPCLSLRAALIKRCERLQLLAQGEALLAQVEGERLQLDRHNRQWLQETRAKPQIDFDLSPEELQIALARL